MAVGRSAGAHTIAAVASPRQARHSVAPGADAPTLRLVVDVAEGPADLQPDAAHARDDVVPDDARAEHGLQERHRRRRARREDVRMIEADAHAQAA
jgi:hypothetical protein